MRTPYLKASLDIGWVAFHTAIMAERLEMNTTEYIMLFWRVFKWHGEFRLYRPNVEVFGKRKEASR